MKKMLLKKWWNILKIKTPDGHDLEINSIKNFKTVVKATFTEAAEDTWGPAQRKSYVRTEHKAGPTGGPHNFWLTFRHDLDPQNRKVYNFIFNHEGTTLLHFYGPGINWDANKEFSNEAEFYSELRLAVREELRTLTVQDTARIELETGLTEGDIKRELEAANPGFLYVQGQMVRDPLAPAAEIDENRVVAVRHNVPERTVGDASREQVPPQPTPPKTKKPRKLGTTRGKARSMSERRKAEEGNE